MHDIRAIRAHPDAYEKGWAARGARGQTQTLLDLDARLRASQTAAQSAQSRRNELSRAIGAARKAGDEAQAARLTEEVDRLKDDLAMGSALEAELARALTDRLSLLPNIPADDTPPGDDESGNLEVRRWGEPLRRNDPRDHVDLGAALKLMNFERAARMSGSRFVVLSGALARLERALGQFMLDLHTREHGYTEVSPPLLVRGDALYGSGQLPKFAD
ncbi:MAG: serine--tRNA ligase, partial [Caulobacteraceae bacterium]|nr:serine--tRNA ligase [Caulobacteraceae bacterium]